MKCFKQRFFSFCCWTLVLWSSSVAIATQSVIPLQLHPADLKLSLNRIVEVKIDNNEEANRTSATMKSLERTLNALQPSLIMDLVHLSDETPLSNSQTAFFLEMRQKILATNARCKFAVTLNVSNYLTTPELLSKLQEITTKLGPDIINMAVASSSEVISPTALGRGIECAHAHGQLVSYEGPANMIPDKIDLFVMKAVNGEVHRDEISTFKTRHHLPVMIQVPMMTRNQDSKETLLMARLAEEQASFGYHLVYPLQLTSAGSLNANGDASFLVTLRALMTRYN